MRFFPGLAACLSTALIVSSVAFAQGSVPNVAGSGPLVRFTDAAALDRFARRMEREMRSYGAEGEGGVALNAPPMPIPPPQFEVPLPSISTPNMAPADAASAAADGAAAAGVEYLQSPPTPESITNTQVAGVDEGGIVKNAGDYLVVLRRGRLFTIRTGSDALAPADSIDAFPPGKANAADAWYDEMLVHGDTVIVIGYSYVDSGTEVNRFRLGADGSLTYRDTHYLTSSDYYSDENYASRLMGDRLIFYTPVPMAWNDWRDALPTMRRRLAGGRMGAETRLMGAQDIYLPRTAFERGIGPDILHTVVSCDLAAAQFTCTAQGVAGSWSRSFYASQSAAYVWTEAFAPWYLDDGEEKPDPARLVRLPLDGSAPGAINVSGGPVNQFSFDEDAEDGVLRVVLRADSYGDGMWASRIANGEAGLLTIPLAAFTRGTGDLGSETLRKLPDLGDRMFENRFVGRHLLYSATRFDNGGTGHSLLVVPFTGGAISRIALPHAAARLDVLGRDAVVVGSTAGGELGFTAVGLGAEPAVQSTFILPGASEGESRSQAFFYRADPGSDGDAGTLGLPIMRAIGRRDLGQYGVTAAILFLRRDARLLAEAGELTAGQPQKDDNCIASCVDWYGNARPIFLGGRVFALMGYELVEGTLAGGRIGERRRVDFSPSS